MKIAICGLVNNENLGEKFISKSLCWIISEVVKEHRNDINLDFVEVDVQAAKKEKVFTKNPIKDRVLNLYFYSYGGCFLMRSIMR